jgi:nitrite reductase/ring-hydroxylating ferredoxin subunit
MPQRIVVPKAATLGDRKTVKFTFTVGDDRKEGFVIARSGKLYAYRNECRHIPMTMDWVENRFLSRDRCYIQCATHGALFEIETGLCIDGPPAGERLRALETEVNGEDVIVIVPD